MNNDIGKKTIADFGQQWTTYRDNSGFYGSVDLFRQIVEPLVQVDEFRGMRVAEIGAGTGRISSMILEAGAAGVTAIEPSSAFDVLRDNTAHFGDRIHCVHAAGENIPNDQFDLVLSIGVLHHIPDPKPVLQAAYAALRPGGRMLVWIYGKEGNELYLMFVQPLRALTKRMPHAVNAALSWIIDLPLLAYIAACRYVRLPMHTYMTETLGRITPDKRRLVIYDQINPEWAEYYTRDRAERLLGDAGFADIRLHHRGNYSWTVVGTKPALVDVGRDAI